MLSDWQGDANGAYPYAMGYWLPREVAMLMGSDGIKTHGPLKRAQQQPYGVHDAVGHEVLPA